VRDCVDVLVSIAWCGSTAGTFVSAMSFGTGVWMFGAIGLTHPFSFVNAMVRRCRLTPGCTRLDPMLTALASGAYTR
jgi:hypothetical protein